jgi:hypothetical protein
MPGVRRQLVEEQRYWLDIGDSQFSRITVDANLTPAEHFCFATHDPLQGNIAPVSLCEYGMGPCECINATLHCVRKGVRVTALAQPNDAWTSASAFFAR